MQVVVDQPRAVLQVETFGEHVGRNEDANLRRGLRPRASALVAVVVGRETADDLAAVLLAAAVDLLDAFDAGLFKLLFEVAGGLRVFREDQHLVPLQHRRRISRA